MGIKSARNLAGAVNRMLVVVQPEDDTFARLVQQAGWLAVPCAQWRAGMGASLACGVRACGTAEGWIVALADMPFIQTATIVAVVDALRAGVAIAAAVQGGRRGHPVGFSRHYYAELTALTGDTGARHILERDSSGITQVAVNDPGIFRDVDRPGDVQTPRVLQS